VSVLEPRRHVGTVVCAFDPFASRDNAVLSVAVELANRHAAKLVIVGAMRRPWWSCVVHPFGPVTCLPIGPDDCARAVTRQAARYVPADLPVTISTVPFSEARELLGAAPPEHVIQLAGDSLRRAAARRRRIGHAWRRMRARFKAAGVSGSSTGSPPIPGEI
jgi:hypothetical protein